MMDREETAMDGGGWDEFFKRANKLKSSGELDKFENDPKRKIARYLEEARKELVAETDGWAELVEKGLSSPHTYYTHRQGFSEWMADSKKDASETLKALWTEDEMSAGQRVRAFCELLPDNDVFHGLGTRTRIVSVLLMGLDVEQYPPFGKMKFQKACERMGYEPPDWGGDEADLYEYFLGFLDQFREEAAAHGVHLRHRLDAQGVVWRLNDELPKQGAQPVEPKPLHALADELHLPTDFLEEISTLLDDKRQVIFQGPPGTGKTFVAQALAKYLARTEDQVTLVQFHPSYAYEDFVRGFRPTLEEGRPGFRLQDGPLLRAAKKASKEESAKHFLIIDEINRGNLAKVFGELYFLLEYRDKSIRLQYQQEEEDDFSLPENLYIIGTMNTADRSIALVDLALRRRFYFIEFHPDEEPIKGVLRRWLGKGSDMEWVPDVVEEANKQLEEYKHAAIGPSYFMKDGLRKKDVPRIWKHSVLPYIEELLFGDDAKIKQLQLHALCQKVASNIIWDRDDEQKDDEAASNSEVVNDATDQPSGAPREQSNPP